MFPKFDVILTISSSRVGGAQYFVKQWAHLLDNKFNVRVFYGKADGGAFREICESKLNYVRGLNIPFNFFAIIKLIKNFSQNNTYLISNSFGAGINSRIASLFNKNVVSVYVTHGWSFQYQKFSTLFRFIEMAFSNIGYIWCISLSDYRVAQDILFIPRNRLLYFRNRVVRTKHENCRSGNGLNRNILYVGRSEVPKRVDLFIGLAEKFSSHNFYIVGSGENFHTLPSNCFNLGIINDFNDYSCFDLFCLFSDSEGLPLSAIQAASVGIPLLLSDVGGCSEIIKYGNGLVVKNCDSSVEIGFIDIMKNYELYIFHAVKHQDRNILDFNSNKSVNRLLGLISKITSN